MGPISINWYRERGLVRKVDRILQTDFHPTLKKGDVWEVDEIITQYAAGRIDVYGMGEYGPEISVKPMLSSDWFQFSEWLCTFECETLWTLDELVLEYEKTNPKITWYKET